MILKDKIYGEFEVEPVFKEVINSNSLQRLKDISQFGVPAGYYHLSNEECYSRFLHSKGVMLLLRFLGATKEEQLAGLIHDISHTAFSHVIDWVKGNNQEDFQDSRFARYFKSSELPELLRKYDYDPERLQTEDNFPLLEQKLPDLCADRIDYLFQEIGAKEARELVGKLRVQPNEIVFNDQESALRFANYFLDRQMNHWGGYEAIVRYRLFAEILKRALEKNILYFDSFWGTESLILNRLEDCGDRLITETLEILKKDSLKNLPRGSKKERKKFRYVDPKFGNNLDYLSKLNENFAERLRSAKEKNEKGITLPALPILNSKS